MNRRHFLAGMGSVIFAGCATPALGFTGGWRATDYGIRPGLVEDQGIALQSVLEQASLANQPVFLEPGHYRVSNLTLPQNVRLYGVKGATILEYGGGTHFLYGENLELAHFEGLTLDGLLRPVKEYADANLRFTNVKNLTVRDCHIKNAANYGLMVERSSGHIAENLIDNAFGYAGIMGVANDGLTISRNTVQDCANGGILAYRWERAEDTTIISGNRIQRIAAVKGGTGPHGNGINSYQCDGIIIADNHVSDCAFSTIRSNSCNNIQITNNTCLRAGETSIYSEFAFQGANVSGNIVDGAARGISIANLDHGGRLSICANNLVRNLHEQVPYDPEGHIYGTGILAEADIAITGNVVENASRFGMLLGWGPFLKNVVASNNMIRQVQNGIYLSVVEGIGSVSITDNILSEVTSAAILGHRWTDPVTDDLARSSTKAFPTLQISGNKLDT